MEAIDPKAGTAHVVCKWCKTVLQHPNHDKHMSTHNLNTHLGSCFKYKRGEAKQQVDEEGTVNNLNDLWGAHDRTPMTNNRLAEQVLRIIIAGNLSFLHTENPEFVTFVKHAYPHLTLPNRRAVSNLLTQKAKEAKEALRKRFAEIDSRVSFAIDAWRSRGITEFLG